MIECELRLVLLSQQDHELKILVSRSSSAGADAVYPHAFLAQPTLQWGATVSLLKSIFPLNPDEVDAWVNAPRFKERIIDVLDAPGVPGGVAGDCSRVVIARAVAVPPSLAALAQGWVGFHEMLAQSATQGRVGDLEITHTCLYKLREWTRYSSLVFELLPEVFSIQDLRASMIDLAQVDIDPGNFHRRLKKLDILRPLGSGQRVHRWEFVWSRSSVLRAEGIIPS